MNKPEWAVSLQKARQKKNLTQKQLAQILGISEFSVIGYENGKRYPNDYITQILLFKHLNIPLTMWNFTNKNKKKINKYDKLLKQYNKLLKQYKRIKEAIEFLKGENK